MAASPVTSVKVTGARELRRAMKAAQADMSQLTQVHRDVGKVVQRRGESTAPRRTGALAGSLRSQPTRTKARVGSRLPYAAPVHWGVPARNMEPNPWLSAAAVQTESQWESIYRSAIQDILTDIEGSTPT